MLGLFRPLEEYFRPFSFEEYEYNWILEEGFEDVSVSP
jgi:hypothetical protein